MNNSIEAGAIEVSNVSKAYGPRANRVVDNISFTVNNGEFMTLLGPSGSGKTTTLQMIAGLTEITEGTISVRGRDVSRLASHKRNLGVVFQQYALFPHMSVRQNIAFPLRRRGISRDETRIRVDEVLEKVSLTALADRRPSELSGGQQQRVAVARAIVFGPDALLMDEPFGALDKSLRERLQRELSILHRELGMTFIFVTHDQEEALTLSDRIAVFNEGRIEQLGTPHELYREPTTEFIARFIGESNVLPGNRRGSGTFNTGVIDLRVAEAESASSSDNAWSLVFRPEVVELAADAASTPAEHNSVEAVVINIAYTGEALRVELEAQGGQIIRAKVPAHRARVQIGDRTVAHWPVQDQRLVPSSPGVA